MREYIDRRRFGAAAVVALAGCVGGEGEEANGDANAEPAGSISVPDQEGQGEELHIAEATANVEFRIVLEYDNGRLESEPLPADADASGSYTTDEPIRSAGPIEAVLVSTDGAELDSTTFRYELVPPGPEMHAADAHSILEDRTGHLGPWPLFEGIENVSLESAAAGYTVEFSWIHEYWYGYTGSVDEDGTEENVAWANAAFLQALYQSEYAIDAVHVTTVQLRGRDQVGDPVLAESGRVEISRSAAEQIDWDNLVDEGSFPGGLEHAADHYEFTVHEPVD